MTHIAQSPSGVKITALFRYVPGLPRTVGAWAKGLVRIAPASVLRWLVGVLTGMPSDAVGVTMRLLGSEMGVYQAL